VIVKVGAKEILINPAYMPYIESKQRIQIFFGGSSSG
jgi:hypothetical protein